MLARRSVLLITALVALSALAVVAVAMRLSVYRIASGSMEPQFPVGSLVIDSAAVPLEIGRAVTFTAEGSTVTHVLTGYSENGSLVTRGTANQTADAWRSPVYPGDVRGRVLFGIPLTSLSFWMSRRGIVTVVALMTGSFVALLWVYARRVERKAGAHPRLHSSSK